MSSQKITAIQNENLPVQKGKGDAIQNAKAPKSMHKGRKALADISNTRRSVPSNRSKLFSLKERSRVSVSGSRKRVPRIDGFTCKEIKNFNKWAEKGIEHVHFSGNDLDMLQDNARDKCVKKEIESAMSALCSWTRMTCSLERPLKARGDQSGDSIKLDMTPRLFLPVTSLHSASGSYDEAISPEGENAPGSPWNCWLELKLDGNAKNDIN